MAWTEVRSDENLSSCLKREAQLLKSISLFPSTSLSDSDLDRWNLSSKFLCRKKTSVLSVLLKDMASKANTSTKSTRIRFLSTSCIPQFFGEPFIRTQTYPKREHWSFQRGARERKQCKSFKLLDLRVWCAKDSRNITGRSGQSVTASDFGSKGPRFESGRGRCVESLDKALYSHCPKEKPSH